MGIGIGRGMGGGCWKVRIENNGRSEGNEFWVYICCVSERIIYSEGPLEAVVINAEAMC